MARKRLGDLLREEVKNPAEAANEAVPQEPQSSPETHSNQEPTSTSKSMEKPSSGASTELDTQVNELKASLKTAQKTEADLQKQVTTLQSDLKNQKSLVQQLQAELEQAKSTILKLAEASKESKPTPTRTTDAVTVQKGHFKPQGSTVEKLPFHSIHPHAASRSTIDVGWAD